VIIGPIAVYGLVVAWALLGSGGAILAQYNVPEIEAGGSTDGPLPSGSRPKELPVEKGEGCYGSSR
jgi:hypothetical protein